MIVAPLLSFVVHWFLMAVRPFVSRSMIKRPTSGKKLAYYATAASLFQFLLGHWPFFISRILLETIGRIGLHALFFQAPLFPDAVVGVALPHILCYASCLTLLPLISSLLGRPLDPAVGDLLTHVPCLVVALYYISCRMLTEKGPSSSGSSHQITFRASLIIALNFLLQCVALWTLVRASENVSPATIAFLTAGIPLAPLLAATLVLQLRVIERERKGKEYHALQNRMKSAVVQALREERHEFLNKLALISVYLQLGQWHKAQSYVQYAAASLSDEHDYPPLPADIWSALLEAKKRAAAEKGIEFRLHLKAEPPQSQAEQRLLPQLVSNLLDNAFEAVSRVPNPQVKLFWERNEEGRVFRVSNNGPPIPPRQANIIFQPGVTTKQDSNGIHGWGLVICRRIAKELGGTLTFASTEGETSFTLTLPSSKADAGAPDGPHP